MSKKSSIIVIAQFLFLLAGWGGADVAGQPIVANSSSEFSSVQGRSNWYYGYYHDAFDGSVFTEMSEYSSGFWYAQNGTFWTSLWNTGGHPNGPVTSSGRTPVEHWAVRRWICEVDGLIRISGRLAKVQSEGGDGVTGHIIVDGQTIWSQYIAFDNSSGISYSASATVHIGSQVDFAIDPGETDFADGSTLTGLITDMSAAVVPGIVIGFPSPAMTSTSGPVDFPTTYTSYSAMTMALTPDKVTLLGSSGTVAADVTILNGTTLNPIIRLGNITGFGKLRVIILAGTAFNAYGYSAPAGPSQPASVYPPLGAPPVSPVSSGLSLWWDVSDVDGVNNSTISDGSNFTLWKDRSGNGNDGTARGAGAILRKTVADLNGNHTVEFHADKANEAYDFTTPITDVRTVFWVLKSAPADGEVHFLMGAPMDWGGGCGWHSGGNGAPVGDVSEWVMDPVEFGEWRVLGEIINAKTTSLIPYGDTVVSVATQGNAQASWFAGDARPELPNARAWNGNLSELLIYNRELTAAELAQTGRYLAGRYNRATAYGYPDLPTATLTNPAVDITILPNTQVELKATASAGAGAAIQSVDFYVNDALVGTDTSANTSGEWTMPWTSPATPGVASVIAVAHDNNSPSLGAGSAMSLITIENPTFVTTTGTGTGTSWADASSLSDAFANGRSILYIKAGAYSVTTTLVPSGNALAMYGGFAGTETLPGQRAATGNEAILDGLDNTHQILNSSVPLTVDRVTFKRGFATSGGAIFSSAPTSINNCRFQDNRSDGSWGNQGGGSGIRCDAALTVTNSEFTGNDTDDTDGMFAGRGAIWHRSDDNGYLLVRNCRFLNNAAGLGAGVAFHGAGTVDSCWFENGTSVGHDLDAPGVWWMYGTRVTVTNCVFKGNSAERNAGALLCRAGGGAVINCVFVNNDSLGNNNGSPLSDGIRHRDPVAGLYVANCIFTGHADLAVSAGTSHTGMEGGEWVTMANNLLEGATPGTGAGPNGTQPGINDTGTITVSPQFVNAAAGDFRLLSISPAINAGTLAPYTDAWSGFSPTYPARDYAGEFRGDGRPDLGAYETILSWIISPVRSGQILAGDTLRFTAASSGGSCRWDFGDGRESTLLTPGLVTFPTPGQQTIELYATDAQGQSEILVSARTLTVAPDLGGIPDLSVTAFNVPPGLEIGQSSAAVFYTVRNDGDAALTGASWTDALYLSKDPYLDADDSLLTSASSAQDLNVGESYQGSLTPTIPAVAGASYYLILSVDDEWEVLERHQLNNERAALLDVALQSLEEGPGAPVAFSEGRLAHYYKMEVSSGQNLLLNLDASLAGLRVYVRFGALPTTGVYDYVWEGGELLIPAAAAGTWYILVYYDSAPQPGEYTIEFETVELKLLSVSPPSLGEAAPMELTLTGAGFAKPIQVELAAAGGATYPAGTVEVDSFTQITASFAAGAVPPGVYGVRVSQSGGGSSELPGAFEVVAGGEARLEADLILPAPVGYSTPATLYVEYRNTGTVAMLSPLLALTASQNGREAAILTLDKTRLSQGFWTSAMPEGFSNSVQFLASGENPGVLQPGESGRVPVYYVGWVLPWDWSFPPIQWKLGALCADDTTPADWPSLKAGMRPSYVREDAWDAVWANFTSQAGSTWGDYVAMLDRNAVYLNRLGQRVEDIRHLLSLSFRQADALSPIAHLASGTDAQVQAPGLPMAFRRAFAQPISRRYELGPLGRGWAHNWQISLQSETDGTIVIADMTGTPRIFQPDRRYPDRYLAQPGDQGVLTAISGGGWTLREGDGPVLVFHADGKLNCVEDTNSNRITCGYSGEHLTDLTHSSGQSLHLAYNAAGRITSVTDDNARQTVYTYSADGEHLASVEAYDGRTTTYAYSLGQGAAKEHALTEIAFPGGTHQYFTYDAQGRLASTTRDNDAEAVAFDYDSAGTVAATDALNNTSRFSFDHWGRAAKSEDALGRAVHLAFDALGNLTTVTDPAGHTQAYAYDSRRNLIRSMDPLRHTTRFSYLRPFNRLGYVTDANGNRTAYSYDTCGNLTAVSHADGNRETWTCDAWGNPSAWTNRRGNAIGYTFDTNGRVTQKTHPGGSHVDYAYDTRGNLTQAVDASGTTAFTYDSNDYLTRIAYPGGRSLEFTYNAAGRRASSLDQLGRRLDYRYDAAGRLESMSDETAAQVVQYEYDAAGRLSRKTVGNGVYTTYEYDAAGQLLQLVNRKPNDGILSRFEYAYDSRGRRTTMDTHYGLWTYGYDDTGQLVRATLDSTDPGILDQDLTYVYDALGNRVYTLLNGVREDYVANSMNQYVEVGDRTYTFDADGNLTQESGPGGTTVYTYSDENRLVGVARGADTWEYTYDALGNRVAASENGAVTHYVVDPIGLGNVVGEYNAAGGLIARYNHGFGLLDRIDGGGNPACYTFDAVGNSHELTIAAGAIADAYGYEPYGALLKSTGAVPNPFEFVGEYGVMKDGNALNYMRTREFASDMGRFISSDPLGLVGDDANLYRYAGNNPLSLSDPTGLTCWTGWKPETLVPLVTVPARRILSQNGKEERIGGAPGDSPLFQRCRRQAADAKHCYYSQKPVTPPQAPCGDTLTSQTTATTGPRDPNGKLGPSGFGAENFVTGEEPFAYRVDFENDPAASAPAQIVIVEDALSSNLDWTTFELTEIGFGDQLVTVPSGLKHFETAAPFTRNDVDFEVRIEAGIHADSGKAYANFYSIDPGTELPPAASVGFLPPEDGTGRGMGHVSYIIRPKQGLATGAAIRNVATIQFNFGETIATNQVSPHDPSQGTDPNKEALVTIDAGAPASHVVALPATTATRAFQVSWTGADDTGGSGIAGYDVFVRDNGGPWSLWRDNSTETSAVFTGVEGHTYGFYSVATDNVGRREGTPPQADAVTEIATTPGIPAGSEDWTLYE